MHLLWHRLRFLLAMFPLLKAERLLIKLIIVKSLDEYKSQSRCCGLFSLTAVAIVCVNHPVFV